MMTKQPPWVQLFDLLLIQLTNWRWSWTGTIVFSILSPIFLILVLGLFAERQDLGYILTGNMVLALLLDGLSKISGHFSFMRTNGTLDYFATLPINRALFVLATLLAFLLLALPSVVVTLLLGAFILGIPLSISPLVVPVVVLISATLAGLGAMIALVVRTPDQVNSLSLLATLVLFGLGPVLIPADRLPDIILTTSLFSPTTYAASALRQTVLGVSDRIPLGVDLLVLAAISVVLLLLVSTRLDWRGRT